jgi:hypothetical protein
MYSVSVRQKTRSSDEWLYFEMPDKDGAMNLAHTLQICPTICEVAVWGNGKQHYYKDLAKYGDFTPMYAKPMQLVCESEMMEEVNK